MSRMVPDAAFEPWRETDGRPRPCQVAGCPELGEYRAPMAPNRLREYYWFCLEHVRAYNAAWNYYAGMSPEEIERHRRYDTVWQRPSWPFGTPSYKREQQIEEELRRRFFDHFENGGYANGSRYHAPPQPQSEYEKALSVLDLEPKASGAEIKARYKKLVKQLHPDANGGDLAAEERLKMVTQAYATLRNGSD